MDLVSYTNVKNPMDNLMGTIFSFSSLLKFSNWVNKWNSACSVGISIIHQAYNSGI